MKRLSTALLVYTLVTSTAVPNGKEHKGESGESACSTPVCTVYQVIDNTTGKPVMKCVSDPAPCQNMIDANK